MEELTVQQSQPLPEKLTEAELQSYDETAAQICKSILGCSKVHPVVFIDKENGFKRSVCYLKEPTYMTKILVMDKATTIGAYSAADELRVACTIKENSDAIMYGEGPECDKFKMGIVDYCLTLVSRMQQQFKKK